MQVTEISNVLWGSTEVKAYLVSPEIVVASALARRIIESGSYPESKIYWWVGD